MCELLKTWPVAAYCEHFPCCVVDFPMTLENSTVAVYVMKRCNFAKSDHFGEKKNKIRIFC